MHTSRRFSYYLIMVMMIAFALIGCSSELNKRLITAAGDGNIGQVNELLQHGANVNYKLFDAGTTPLIAAASRGHIDVAEILLAAGAQINATDDGVGTALYWAAFEGRVRMVKLLLSRGGKLNCQFDSAAYLLQIIRKRGYREVEELVQVQLEKEGIAILSQPKDRN